MKPAKETKLNHETSKFEQYLTDLSSTPGKSTTTSGREVSHFTMVCSFNNKPVTSRPWTYRGDEALKKCKAGGIANIKNELQALLLKYCHIQNTYRWCRIYNNHLPQIKSLIFSETAANGILINKTLEELNKLEA